MSELEEKKYVGDVGIQRLWERIKQQFVRKDGDKVLSDNNFTDAEKQKLAGIEENANRYELPMASASTLGGVKIGDGIEIDANGVIKTVVNPHLTMAWDNITHTPTTLEGYGITDGATKLELAEVAAEVKKLFKYCGTVATVADLENIIAPNIGDVYNVEADGNDYAWNGTEWDSLGSVIDMSLYWSKAELVEITNDEIDIITGAASSPEIFEQIVENGGDAMLVKDMAIGETLTVDKPLVIDLNGCKIESDLNNAPLFEVDGGELTLKGAGSVETGKWIARVSNGGSVTIESGDYTTGNEAFKAIGEGSKLVMNGGTIHGVECALGANQGAEIELNGGTIITSDNMGIGTNGSNGQGGNKITMNGGEIIGSITSNGYEAIGVYIANNDTFIMNGGRIVGNGGAGLLMRAGNVTINGGEIVAQASENRPAGSTGWIGDKKKNMTQSAVIYDEASNYPGKAGMSLTINGGEFTGMAHSVEVLSNEVEPDVVITGGEFTPDYPEE